MEITKLIDTVSNVDGFKDDTIKRLEKLGVPLDEEEETKKPVKRTKSQEVNMQKWEYMTLQLVMNDKENLVWYDAVEDNRNISERLNEFGAEGWELVGVDSRGLSGITIRTVFYLKRRTE